MLDDSVKMNSRQWTTGSTAKEGGLHLWTTETVLNEIIKGKNTDR